MTNFIVKKVAVLGAGVMGAQIAAHCVNAKVPVVLFDQRASRLQLTLFGVWQVAFLLRWAYCPTSPLLDSISVFTDRFLDLDLRLPMGAIYARQPKMLGVDSFLFFGYAFAASSFALLLSMLPAKKTS